MPVGRSIALAACVFAASAQEPQTVLRTTTRLVQVRVVAYDSKGASISGLTRDDFRLFDNGADRPITLFAAESGVAPAKSGNSPTTAAPEPVPARDDTAVVLLDWVNTSRPDRLFAYDAVKKVLAGFQPRQKVALYALAPELRILHQFTTDTGELLDAVNDLGTEFGEFRNLPAGSVPAPGERRPSEIQLLELDTRIRSALDAFGALADRLAHMPGRKSLVWVSDGLPMVVDGNLVPGARPAERVYVPDIERLLAKLNRADIAVYSVNAAGLPAPPSKEVPHNAMFELSQRTGGTVFADRNDLDSGIRMALADIDASYTLGFNVPDDAAPGPHGIRVRVSRPGVTLRYRESYAVDPPAHR